MTDPQLSHNLLCKLKDLAIEIGRTPSRDAFLARFGGNHRRLIDSFGGFEALKIAAGMKDPKPERITNAVFERDIERHLDEYEPKPPFVRGPWPSIASLSDVHLPFWNLSVVDRFVEYVGDVKPEWVILAGDIWDFLSHSKFPRSHNIFLPKDERAMCMKMNAEIWDRIKKCSPKSKCYQLTGNHENRPLKRILEEYPSGEEWIIEMLKRDLSFPGVTTILDPRDYLLIQDDIIVMHGFKTQAGSHRDMARMNVISGHSHRGSVTYRRLMDRTIWELNCGFAGDPLGKGLTYTPSKIPEWTPGFGLINKQGPQFVPV